MTNIQFAIDMELDGERYYREQADKNEADGLKTVFMMLAEDESLHARALQNRLNGLPGQLADGDILTKAQNVFAGMQDWHSPLKVVPAQLDVYRAALKMEQQSIHLYEELLAAATDDAARRLFDYLVKQEQKHFAVLAEVVSHVGRPEEWVESAEFGRRKEY